MLERAKEFYRAHEPACAAGFFAGGFLFDTLAVGRIDSLHNIVHQASYLSLCAWFTGLELREAYGFFSPPERLKTFWRYHEAATHFMLGTLLNIYTLFYFKSASLTASFVFMLFLCALLAINELKPFQKAGTTMRIILWSLCLVSYFTYLVPVIVGEIGVLPFIGSMAAAAAAMAASVWLLNRGLPDRPQVAWRNIVIPFLAVEFAFSGLYAAKLIPPVPLSLSAIGIYHDIRRENGGFTLVMTRPRWKFWQRGDQTFLARPGDKPHCFVRVFSPARFKERLQVRWLDLGPDGAWRDSDAIPLDIRGGRGEGWRGFTVKSRYSPGRWRVRVETSDGRELGRIGFTVVEDDSRGPREERTVPD